MITVKDLSFCGPAVVDPVGRVFDYQGNIYRLIYEASEASCRELLDSGLIEELVELSYIPKSYIETDLRIEGNPMVLKHEKCFISNPYEWSFAMFKDAAIHVLKVNEICNKYGYELKDAHPLNITFHNCKPVFLDFGSIVKKTKTEWVARDEFLQKCYLPLLLWEAGDISILRNILECPDMYAENRVLPQQPFIATPYFRKYLVKDSGYRIRMLGRTGFYKKIPAPILIKAVNKFSKLMRGRKLIHIERYETMHYPSITEVSNITKFGNTTEWENYHDYIQPKEKYPRFVRIAELIRQHCSDAETIVDLAGNGGVLSLVLQELIGFKHIFTIDYDGNATDKAYAFFKTQTKNVDVVCANVMRPFEAKSFGKRIKSDIAIACALTHHLVLRQGIPLYAIFERFSSYCEKYIVIEFMPLGLWNGTSGPPVPEWYSKDWFKDTFCQYFQLIHEEQLENNKIVFIGKKIK